MSVGLPAPGGSHSPTHTHTCMRASVAGSVLAVASSRTITLLCDSRARARHSSCRWPTLRFCPPDSMGASRPPMCDTYSFMSTRSRASHSSRSLGAAATCDSLTRSATGREAAMSASPSWASRAAWGLRLERMVPWNSVGSWRKGKAITVSTWQGYAPLSAPRYTCIPTCGMILRCCRKSWRPMVSMSTPSMTMEPASKPTRRKRQDTREDLPAPVRPTMPTLEPPGTAKLTSLSTSGAPARYLMDTPLNATAPTALLGGGGHKHSTRVVRETLLPQRGSGGQCMSLTCRPLCACCDCAA